MLVLDGEEYFVMVLLMVVLCWGNGCGFYDYDV